jgi:glycosyltransferase involved in cell wall biosynthesis
MPASDGEDGPGVGGVCVVTLRASEANQNATHELLDILSAFTSAALLTAGLTQDASLRDEYEVVELADTGSGRGLFSMLLRFPLNQLRLSRAIAAREEDVILFFGPTAYVFPVLFARLWGKTVIVEPRGDVPLTLKLRWAETVPGPVASSLAWCVRRLERLSFRIAHAIITYTPSMADELGLDRYEQKHYTRGARHVALDRFDVSTSFDDRDDRIGFVGRLDVEKGVPTLAAVAESLEDISMTFVGDGSFRDDLEARLTRQIENGQVESLGWIEHSDVPDQMNRFKLLLMPSEPTEGLPTTILEAFACGTPVFATPVSGVPDVVREEETGFLMREEDPEAIANRVQEILARDDLSEISANARSLAENEFSFDRTVQRYREMFEAIV